MQQEKSNPDSLPSADTTLPRNCLRASTTCTVQISFAPKEYNIAEKKYIDHVPFLSAEGEGANDVVVVNVSS